MSVLSNDPAQFADEALRGFADAWSGVVTLVPGGVVRAAATPPGKAAVVVGGGSGHYPAFCGLVGPGFADGAVVGNIFTSPSADDAASVARSAASDAGVLMLTGNYAGDVMNFGLARQRLVAEGIDARYLVVTDDIASAPVGQEDQRRGIAGDLTVFKVAAAAAEAGYDLDGVERAARHANARTRTLGVAFDGCTLPGADSPLFTVPDGVMGIGVGIHGEPGIGETAMPTAAGLARTLVEHVLAEAPEAGMSSSTARAAVVLNGLGRTKYEELFVVWSTVAPLLREAGITIVEPDVGELVTSLDMSGCSLTLMWLDDELERLWCAPAAAPAYRKGRLGDAGAASGTASGTPASAQTSRAARPSTPPADAPADEIVPASERGRAHATLLVSAMEAAVRALVDAEQSLGRLDSVAGDGDHGRGMVRGGSAALDAARDVVEAGGSAGEALVRAGRAWASRAGGTSGVLWGAMLEAAGGALGDDPAAWQRWDADATGTLAAAVGAAIDAMRTLGGAEPGDKTMLDALGPFHETLAGASGGGDVPAAWSASAAVATQAAQATADLRPRRGRARPLAEQSVGSPDPGAVSLALITTAVSPTAGTGTGTHTDVTEEDA
jgi:dihydroxyacetone kinase